jgi:hypothetical protein
LSNNASTNHSRAPKTFSRATAEENRRTPSLSSKFSRKCTRHFTLFRTVIHLPRTEVNLNPKPSLVCRKPRSTPGQYRNLNLDFTSSFHCTFSKDRQRGLHDVEGSVDSNSTSQVALPTHQRINLCGSQSSPAKSNTPRFSSTYREDSSRYTHQIAYRYLLGQTNRAIRAAVLRHGSES